jgi:phage portal protein BeeE
MDFSLRNLFRREVTGVPSTTNPNDASNQQPKGANWEANIVNPRGNKSLMVPAWFRGVSLRMQTMGQVQIQYQKINAEGGNFIEDRYNLGRKLNYLLQVRPNPMMTASQLQEQIEYRKIYYGNAYVFIERTEYGDVKALWLATGGGYNPIMDTYTITYNGVDGPHIDIKVPAKDVLHFKNVFFDRRLLHGTAHADICIQSPSDCGHCRRSGFAGCGKGW